MKEWYPDKPFACPVWTLQRAGVVEAGNGAAGEYGSGGCVSNGAGRLEAYTGGSRYRTQNEAHVVTATVRSWVVPRVTLVPMWTGLFCVQKTSQDASCTEQDAW